MSENKTKDSKRSRKNLFKARDPCPKPVAVENWRANTIEEKRNPTIFSYGKIREDSRNFRTSPVSRYK